MGIVQELNHSQNKIYIMLINILIAVAFASTFIALFFFTYAKNIERNIVIKNIQYLIDDINNNIVSLLPDNIKQMLSKQMDNIKIPDMTMEDKNVSTNNFNLLINSFIILGSFFVLLISIAFFIAHNKHINFTEIIFENSLLLLGVGVVEYLFLNMVASNYVSIDTNIIKYNIIKTINDNLYNNLNSNEYKSPH